MANPARVESLLRDAGFSDVRTEEVRGRFACADADAYLRLIADTSGPLGLTLQRLGEAERAAVMADVEDSLRRFATDDGYELPPSRCVRSQADVRKPGRLASPIAR
jgi:hypothetical protein